MDDKRGSAHLPLPICTLGATDHGKTTLTAAIAKVVARIGSIHSKIDTPFEQLLHNHYPYTARGKYNLPFNRLRNQWKTLYTD